MELLIITAFITAVSFIVNRKKTIIGIKKGFIRFITIIPALLLMLVLTSFALALLPQDIFARFLGGDNPWLAALMGLVGGSVAVMPGFIAFPLGGILREQGVLYMVIAAFTSSLMMVGVVTFPVEKQFFGIRFALFRNLFGLIISALVALAMGFAFGELLP
ncbi:MAG: hypothetical protein JXA95_13390 [Spirochaetales bacterium]|nr:hypothetical protein [Spirochaetales bacterium]